MKSTITHGSKEIKNRTVSICIACVESWWPSLLHELSCVLIFLELVQNLHGFLFVFGLHYWRKIQMAGGLHERCTFFCFDVHGDADTDHITSITEQRFFANLYEYNHV